MFQITPITDDAFQDRTLTLFDGSSLGLTIKFLPLQASWFITSLSHSNGFVLNGVRISVSPNILRQFKNQIPFGLACFSADLREPSQQQDFSSEHSKLYILDGDEVEEFERFFSQ